ncbi:MAG TPA: nitroreductase/quinone reductase family protein [Ktedonobacteraceae bacterium]|nr:nitroreductase/quinone reductase family protein [Ktedonobacteraceae bacterium]
MTLDVEQFKDENCCYLTTTGRNSGRPHTIEIWFVLNGQTLYMLAGGRYHADWVKNALRFPEVQVKIADTTFTGKARVVNDPAEDALARQIVLAKYVSRSEDDLQDWSRRSLPIAVDLIRGMRLATGIWNEYNR